MSLPNNERPWAPAELDAIEDSLEQLEAPRLPATLSPEQHQRLGARLASYRAIAALSRELLSAHAAPPSAIAAALDEARNAAAAASEAAPVLAVPAPSWWTRARRLWVVPALASASVGALVVVLSISRDAEAPTATVASGEPRSAASVADEPASAAAQAPASSPLAMAEPAKITTPADELAPEQGARGSAADQSEALRGRLLERDKDSDAQAKAEHRDADDLSATDGRRASETRSKRDLPPAPPSPDPKPKAEPKSPSKAPAPMPTKPSAGGVPGSGNTDAPSPAALGDVLLRADRARHTGDCGAARRDYETVIARGDRKQRARAKAGAALCLEREGGAAKAGDLIAGARLDDPGIDAWIAAERRAAE